MTGQKSSVLSIIKPLLRGIIYGVFFSVTAGIILFYYADYIKEFVSNPGWTAYFSAAVVIFLAGILVGKIFSNLNTQKKLDSRKESVINLSLSYIESLIQQDEFDEALFYCRKLLGDVIRGKDLVSFCKIKKNQALCYSNLAKTEDAESNLVKELVTYQEILLALPQSRFPMEHGRTWRNIGNVYKKLSDYNDKKENLELAVNAVKESLQVYSIENNPVAYALGYSSLGSIYGELAKIENRKEYLETAAGFYNSALNVYTLDNYPLEYAITYNNLGYTYLSLSWEDNKEKNLTIALNAYEQALKVYSPEDYPLDHKVMIRNIEKVESRMGEEKNSSVH